MVTTIATGLRRPDLKRFETSQGQIVWPTLRNPILRCMAPDHSCADCGLVFKNLGPDHPSCFKCVKREACGEDKITLAVVELSGPSVVLARPKTPYLRLQLCDGWKLSGTAS
ncbi:hypothetical protein B0H13DRAFT_1855272 [Mycena leptocephala]|nr:hypothetical protein B0H13DRAFT_1855272 [Mycena leptocephala]